MAAYLKTFLHDDQGATMVEYGLIVGLIAVAAIVTVSALSTQIQTVFTNIKNSL